jgi:hypothetical protein
MLWQSLFFPARMALIVHWGSAAPAGAVCSAQLPTTCAPRWLVATRAREIVFAAGGSPALLSGPPLPPSVPLASVVAAAGQGSRLTLITHESESSLVYVVEDPLPLPPSLQPSSPPTPLRLPIRVRAVAAGLHHLLLLDEPLGRVWGVGDPTPAATSASSSSAVSLPPSLVPFPPSAGPVASIVCGWLHSAALTERGHLYLWGSDAHGQCGGGLEDEEEEEEEVGKVGGDGHRPPVLSRPVRLSFLDGTPAADGVTSTGPGGPGAVACVSAGAWHTALVTVHGAVYASGDNSHAQTRGVAAAGVSAAASEVVSPSSIYASRFEQGVGAVAAAGGGAGGASVGFAPVHLDVSSSEGEGEGEEDAVVSVSCGARHTLALTAKGRVFAWGTACEPVRRLGGWGLRRFTLRPTEVDLGAMAAAAAEGAGGAGGVAAAPAAVRAVAISATDEGSVAVVVRQPSDQRQ